MIDQCKLCVLDCKTDEPPYNTGEDQRLPSMV